MSRGGESKAYKCIAVSLQVRAWMTHRANDVAYSTCKFLRISSAREPQHETVMMMMTVIDDGDDGDGGEDGDDGDDHDGDGGDA